jgi:hypothetical protein
VSLAVVLVVASIGAVLLSGGSARDAPPPGSTPAASWNSTDRAYVLAMLWHEQQAQEFAGLVQGRTTRAELHAWRSASAPPGAPTPPG